MSLTSYKRDSIQTFVVLDLETTGLPQFDGNKTRITELAVIAATRKHVIEAGSTEEKLPRVLQKLNLCLYPRKRISLDASRVTGLYNDTLEECGPFDDCVFLILESFFKRLPQPVCIIAHNGLRFDFPILQAELHKLGKCLPDGILCADSLIAFRQLLGQKAAGYDVSSSQKETEQSAQLKGSDQYDGVLYNVAELLDVQCLDDIDEFLCNLVTGNTKRESIEKTPSQAITRTRGPPILKRRAAREESDLKKGNDKVRKQLFGETKAPKRYKLSDVYEFLLGKKPSVSHRAEDDTLTLLKCIISKGPEFVEWTDNNAKLFNDIQKLS